MLATTSMTYIFAIMVCGLHAKKQETTALPKMKNAPEEWTDKKYSHDGWSRNLVDDNVLAQNVLKELKNISADGIAEVYKLFLEHHTKEKRELRRDSAVAQVAKALLDLATRTADQMITVVIVHVLRYLYKKRNTPRCYENVGCFYYEDRLGLDLGAPDKPEDVGTVINLYGSEFNYTIKVDTSVWKQKYVVNWQIDLEKPLCAVIHGFNFNDDIDWMQKMRVALMKKVKCNVLIVTWLKGASIPDYTRAASNTAMVGALLSQLLQDMIRTSNGRLTANGIHVIGFSLGAQAAGFCGRHFYNNTRDKIGRITGLDPAGPLFQGTNVALSKADADFVDIIHTNAGPFHKSMFGMTGPAGHVDFYPNGGGQQLGCEYDMDLGCSHARAIELFTESLTSQCPFTAYPCGSDWTNLLGRGEETDWWCSQSMGYNSVNQQGRGQFYLRTYAKKPYCIRSTQTLIQDSLRKEPFPVPLR
uniref:Pancreatic lipase-related protein 1 n=1 Tax=Rhipicephalus appendiculatus TaxID=34631 RepID=A0A131Z3L2_RHIAP